MKALNISKMIATPFIGKQFSLIVFILVCGSCSSGPREIETPQGPRSADQNGPFIILGVISRNTSTLSQPDAKQEFKETITVNVPPGTQIIIPAVRGWFAGYGKTIPEDYFTQQSNPNSKLNWQHNDEHFGLAWFNVLVDDINAVDSTTSPPTQTAEITITAILGDENLDNRWWASVNYNLLCLGRP
jgi:hypothetical protein